MPEPTATGDPLDQIIADYLQAAEAGHVPSRRELLDRYPEHADRLNQFFADFDRLDNQAQGVRLNTRPPTERPKVRYFGDYELLEEIAEGGMGLVYKARQSTLGRVVALKLVKSGRLARPIDVARFRVEAEAAAGLDHPNIVPLYEVGEHDGQHYLAMKFIDGPSLARLPRGSARQEVERLEAVARAVDFAHRQGILHRDIKPSNILTDTNGTPYVTDFGLAKRLDAEMSLTESGQMLGTAGYIAPEQALGKKGLTVTADVFSLGAVLYERLTGQPAFPGGTILERLRSLHDAATPRPTVAAPGLPRDLETVTLKCLEREPGKRYATAGAVAEDLGRWLRGEAIVARPVSRREKFWLWCRRNPWVAGWAGATALALVGGAVTAWALSVQLYHKERAAEAALQDATNQRQKAGAYFAQAKLALTKFIHTLIQTLGIRINNDRTPTERWAIFEIAKQDDEFKRNLLAEVFAPAKPEFAAKFALSSEFAVQAAVGASEQRRQAALDLAKEKLLDPAVSPDARLAAMTLALRLGAADIEAPDWTGNSCLAPDATCPWTVEIGQLSSAQIALLTPHWLKLLERTTNPAALRWAGEGLARQCDTDPQPSALAARAFDALVGVLGKTTDGSALAAAGQGLAALAPRLDSPAAVRASDALVGVVGKTTDGSALAAAGQGLAALAPRLDGPAAVRASDALVGVLGKTTNGSALQAAGQGLAALAPRLDGPAPVRAFDALVGVLGKTTDWSALWAAGQGLAALAPRLDGPAAARAFDALVGVLGKTTDGDALWAAGQGLAALAPRLDGPAAVRAFDALVGVLGKTTDWSALWAAGQGLAALAPRLDGPAAARASDAWVGVLGKTTDGDALWAAGQGLAALAPRLDGPAAARAFDALVGVLGKTTDGDALWAAGQGLAALAPRLDGPAAVRAFDALVGVLGKTTDWRALPAAGQGLAALAPRLDGPAAERGCRALIECLGKHDQSDVLQRTRAAIHELIERAAESSRPALRQLAGQATISLLRNVLDKNSPHSSWDGLDFLVDEFPLELIGSIPSGELTIGQTNNNIPTLSLSAGVFSTCRQLSAAAHMLTHPACVGDIRRHVLHRLEELAFPPTPEQQQAATVEIAAALADPTAAGVLAAGRQAAWEKQRQFRTIWDAVAWLKVHHPEIDLDKPYTPRR